MRWAFVPSCVRTLRSLGPNFSRPVHSVGPSVRQGVGLRPFPRPDQSRSTSYLGVPSSQVPAPNASSISRVQGIHSYGSTPHALSKAGHPGKQGHGLELAGPGETWYGSQGNRRIAFLPYPHLWQPLISFQNDKSASEVRCLTFIPTTPYRTTFEYK